MERIVIKLTNGETLEFTGLPKTERDLADLRLIAFKKENGSYLYISLDKIISIERTEIEED